MPPSSSLTLTTLHPSSTSNANKDSYSAVPPGHSGRLKYAEPQNLPSFPSVGLRKDHAAASAAASLGWANQKSIEPWKPDDTTASASAAAALANQDCKMPPAWEPERSKAGSKAAALAAGAAQKHHIRQSSSPSAWGNSAANIAFKASKTSSAKVSPPDLARIGSMKAAKGAMAGTRPRSTSSPQVSKHSYPDQANAAANALSAATIAHRPTVRAATNAEGGATPYVHMNRQMFTSLPPVKPEVEEQKRAEVLHASALAMAKRMYNQQQKMIDTTKLAHARSSSFSRHGENASDARHTSAEELTRPMSFNNLQEAAYRLAQERLAKLHVEHQATRDVQEYYGASPASPQKTKFGTVRSKLTRRRAASDGELMDDQARSHQIRKEMSMFNSRLNEVDEQKRARDREALLATAQRNVKARLQGMDQKLFEDTGRIAPGKMSEWESKAQTAARTRVDSQRIANADKVDLGGGKFMDREEVNQIAAKRIQPLLDEINEKAEAERERQLALRLEEEKRREEDQKEKQREKEVQEIHKKLKGQQKDEDKLRKQEIKEEERTRKEGEKAARAEQKRLIKEEKAASKPSGKQPAEYQLGQGSFSATTKNAGISFPKLNLRPRDRDNGVTTPPFERSPISDSDTTSPTSKMRSWFKNRFSRPRAKSSNAAIDDSGSKRGFIGGVALTKMRDHNASMSSIDNRSASMREVAMAGRRPVSTAAILSDSVSKELRECGEREMNNTRARESSIVSSLSSRSTGLDKFMEARSEMSATISPPRLLQDPASGRGSPARESRFSENLE